MKIYCYNVCMKNLAQMLKCSNALLIFSLFCCLFFSSASLIRARRFSPASMPVGSFVNVGGRKFVKVNHNNLMVDANHYQ